ncbi:hypothetical protein [Brevibacterium zhoupengii]|uniref:hypothetical protein n=1 Tax=Brevibacterium zhoupengii TaxID=2898795 RepID=UPI001E616FC7|nr:hypothetical protein [Brevibacterium zhoupengii]
MSEPRTVTNAEELQSAVADGAPIIEVTGTITGSPRIVLSPGTTLRGGRLEFGSKGVMLTGDNILEDVEVIVPEHEVAIYADTSVADWGTLNLRNVTTVGQVALVATDQARSGHIAIDGLAVTAADLRGRFDRPRGFGVEALQGGLTIWNRQPEAGAAITAEVTGISIGTEQTPVRGSGVFVGGHGTDEGKASGGTLTMTRLVTGEIHTDGGIPAGAADLISGGVFVISGAHVDEVVNEGPVTTNGQNDMVLDNWGDVRSWTAKAPITSNGPSGIGFVNFSDIGTLTVTAPIQTFGKGARGFNLYDGSLAEANFESIATHADGSIGIQLSRPLPKLRVKGDISTEGGTGLSLVKGVQMTLKAVALSIKPGGSVEEVRVGGAITTAGDDVVTVEIADTVDSWDVAGGIIARGLRSDGVQVTASGAAPSGVSVTAENGTGITEVE